MAQKDYVARGRAPKKPAPKTKAKPPVPWLRLFITLAGVLGFAYFLYSISGNADDVPQSQASEKEKQQVEDKVEDDPLPEMPVDPYGYPKQLETSTVDIDVEEQYKSDRTYLMQCGSFRQQDQAETMRAKLALQGLEAMVRASDGKNGRWYRVILGPYEYKRDAEADRHVIQRIGISTCLVWDWNL